MTWPNGPWTAYRVLALPRSRLLRVTTTHDQKPRGGRMPRTARRAQLLESALEVFVAQGYHAAAMDDIAEKAGVSKPVLYQHFPGKLELYLALLDQSCDTIIEACNAALARTDDNKMRVTATMHVFYDYVASARARSGWCSSPTSPTRTPCASASTGSPASVPRPSPR